MGPPMLSCSLCIFRVFLDSNLKVSVLFLIRIYFILCISAVNFFSGFMTSIKIIREHVTSTYSDA